MVINKLHTYQWLSWLSWFLIFNHGYQFLINKVELKFLQFSGPPRKDTSFAKDILIQSVTIPGKQPPI